MVDLASKYGNLVECDAPTVLSSRGLGYPAVLDGALSQTENGRGGSSDKQKSTP